MEEEKSQTSKNELDQASSIVCYLQTFKDYHNFLAVISLYGKARHTAEQYDHLAIMMQDRNDQPAIHCSTTMRKIVFPKVLKTNFVTPEVISFSLKQRYSAYIKKSLSLFQRQSAAETGLHSSWAKLEVECLSVVRELV